MKNISVLSRKFSEYMSKGNANSAVKLLSSNIEGGVLSLNKETLIKSDIQDDIGSKMLTKHNLTEDTEAAFIELNFRKCMWLLCATYRAPTQNHDYFFDNINKCLDVYSAYETVALADDFNAQVGEKWFDTFLYQHERIP